jgi:hypothetical protein
MMPRNRLLATSTVTLVATTARGVVGGPNVGGRNGPLNLFREGVDGDAHSYLAE